MLSLRLPPADHYVMFHRDPPHLTHYDSPRPDTAGSAASSAHSPAFLFRPPNDYDNLSPPDDPRPSSSGRPPNDSPSAASAVPDDDPASKTYSFVALPGNAVKKRPRRRYDEIERLYHCSWPGCTKSYGTLNHLNAHIVMQRHGGKRSPGEFKELRKQWRKAKKDEAERAQSSAHHMALGGALLHGGDEYGLHPHPQPQTRMHPLGLHHAHSDPRLAHHPYPPPRHHLQQQQATPLHPYASHAQMGPGPAQLGIPLNLAGPGMERYPAAHPMDDIGMRYGPPAHQQQHQQQQQQQQMYDPAPPRERHSSLYTVPPSMQDAHPHGLAALDTGAGAWSSEPQPGASGSAAAAYDIPASAGASTGARQPWLGDYDRRPAAQHHRLSLPAALPSARYAPPLHQHTQYAHQQPHEPQPRAPHSTLPPDSTLLTPLPGYEPPQPPPGLEYDGEDEGDADAQARYW